MMPRLEWVLTAAGCLHFLQIPCTSHLARRLLLLGPDLQRLSPLNARIVRIFIAAASLWILGLGIAVVWRAEDLTSTPLGRGLCLLLAVFWSARACAQLWLRRVWPAGGAARSWYFGLLALYCTLALSYSGVAVFGWMRAV